MHVVGSDRRNAFFLCQTKPFVPHQNSRTKGTSLGCRLVPEMILIARNSAVWAVPLSQTPSKVPIFSGFGTCKTPAQKFGIFQRPCIMSIKEINQPVVSAIRRIQLSHFCQQRQNDMWVIDQLVRDFMKDTYNSCSGRTSWSKGVLVIKGEMLMVAVSWIDETLDHSLLQDWCYRNRPEIGMLGRDSNWTNPSLFPLTWYFRGKKWKVKEVKL